PCARAPAALAAQAAPAATPAAAPGAKRPMTFVDMQYTKGVGNVALSPDAKWALYTLSSPDWKEARSQSDLYVVSTSGGVKSTRQLTFTRDKNETAPKWAKDGAYFVFASNREAPAAQAQQQQLYVMRPDGGEGRRVTDAKDGVSNFEFSPDGQWLVYRAGKTDEEQLHALPVAALAAGTPLDSLKATALTKHPTGVGLWRWSPDAKRIYFVTADTVDRDEKLRREKRFTANVRNAEAPTSSLWVMDVADRKTTRLTRDTSLSVTNFVLSEDGRYVGFQGVPNNRYKRNVTEQGIYSDLYLLDTQGNAIERLTTNDEGGESGISFSPDSKWMAFSASDDMTAYNMKNRRVYLRRVDDRGGQWRKVGASFDGDVGADFWSKDGKTIYFNEGLKATNQLFALDVASGNVRQVTSEKASLQVVQDDDTKRILVQYSDPATPATLYLAPSIEQVARRAAWTQLTDANPQVRSLALGETTEITWTSKDGKPVGGVLVKPVGYEPGKKYPLLVAIHGGPASADVLGFNGGYGAQVYAGSGWVVLMPNYRGSTNYGEAHKTGIVGNYFDPGYQDIMTGVDKLIADGMVDSTKMGVLGWSAGGHWSNWILTHTDRFKAISSGAGTSNWISMYAQSDVQRNRQFYLGNKLPYEDFDAYWNQSPIKYIKAAKTPTMIHVVEGDPRVPSPQSVELHMALKKLNVPTELYMYPGASHGIPDPRNRLVKSVAEKAWMDYYVLGSGKKFAWRDVLKTIEDTPGAPQAPTAVGIQDQP
ncbi:S9 family peptidase, partial [Roseisolibacter sp. H3M3-2]|uniref:S9 family peptidase n=1 Tax=Roseisolibacter sp. H3M3-2 TaxID=3031323 RepID=UPI0023DB2A76